MSFILLINEFLLKLHLCPGIGMKTEYKMYQAMIMGPFKGDIGDLCLKTKLSELQTNKIISNWYTSELDQQVERNQKFCQMITIFDKDYPVQLRESYCPPLVMFFEGDRSLLQTKMLGVVGARKNTSYGRQCTNNIIPAAVEQKITVVSGLAAGIDGLSHQAAIEAGGRTIGIIGTGLDLNYPSVNDELRFDMSRNQLVLTEYPLGSRPFRSHFPERNRIIAGLCETLLVVEAKEKSGSLITASLSLQENLNVCAIPGRIDAPMSAGCNQLILAGAKPVLCTEDLVEEFRN